MTTVLVVGAGAAGLHAALALRRRAPRLSVTVVTPSPYLTFRPWLIHIPSATNRASIRHHLSAAADRAGFALQHGAAEEIDLDRGHVRLRDGSRVGYDRLVIAAGAPADRDRIPGSARHALFPCDADDAAAFADRVRALTAGTVTIVLTGERTGPGLEYAAPLAQHLHATGRSPKIRLRVIDDRQRLMPPLGHKAGRYVHRLLTARGATVLTGAAVAAIDTDGLHLGDGNRLDSDVTAVVGPLAGPDVGLPTAITSSQGFLPTDEFLRLTGHAEVTVVGDAACIDNAPDLPKTWALATRQAATAAAKPHGRIHGSVRRAVRPGRCPPPRRVQVARPCSPAPGGAGPPGGSR